MAIVTSSLKDKNIFSPQSGAEVAEDKIYINIGFLGNQNPIQLKLVFFSEFLCASRSLLRPGGEKSFFNFRAAPPTVIMAVVSENERKVSVHLPGGDYDILVKAGLHAGVGAWLKGKAKSGKVAVVSDSNVFPKFGDAIIGSLADAGLQAIVSVLPAGEDHKTLSDLLPVYDTGLAGRIERSTPVLALGGGVVGDMAGFVAATVLRGVPLVQVPTTLLAMVDASVGGKTGVNHATGKNLIGAFHQPIGVLIDPLALRTLPARELRGGLAECIKHDIIRDYDGFCRLESNIQKALSLDVDYLSELVAHNVAIKAKVIEADPLERGERAHLNFGHTFGHAIETVSRHEYSHGECVALGMTAAAYLAKELGMIDDQSRARIVNLIAKAGLPTGNLGLDTTAVVEAMAFDKKVAAGKVRFVLPTRIGAVIVRDDISRKAVTQAVESLQEAAQASRRG
jgi:3-dehydroquinate synthase